VKLVEVRASWPDTHVNQKKKKKKKKRKKSNTTVPPDKKKEQYLMDTKTINNNESLYKSFQALHLQM
jgi:transcription elongation factor GreA-like protein